MRWLALLLLVPGLALAQTSYNRNPNCIVSGLTACAGVKPGNTAWVTDGVTSADCTTGGGSTGVPCVFNGSAWEVQANTGASGDVTIFDATPALNYIDTDTDDGDIGASIGMNCDDPNSTMEDCDVTIGVQEGGAALNTRLLIDADAGIILGSTANNSVELKTDSTGDTEVVLPVDSISTGEILDETILATDIADIVCFHVLFSSVDPTEAGGTDDFLSLADRAGSTTEDNEDDFLLPPVAGTVNSLGCTTATAPGGAADDDEWTMTINVGPAGTLVNTDVACIILGTATTCSDITNDAPYAAGDSVSIQIDSSTGVSDPTGSALISCQMCLGQ